MTQESVWDKEYKSSKLLVKENIPSADVVRFVKFLKKESVNIENSRVLDLGSGMGRNSFYFTEMGAKVTGLEISKTAIGIAEGNAQNASLDIQYIKQSIGEKFPVDDASVDIVLDVTSSNSLNEGEREVYLDETNRVLKNGGYFFVKALCKDGDLNAKYLLKNSPGPEKDTYIMPELGVTERVWSKEDFIKTYEKYFSIVQMEKKTSYSRMNNRVYKRNFWIVYMKRVNE
ncbi:MAG: class I SAM-dependent methyltransferase [Candidatus Pacebacteria bacterium]|jgi:SAM-dependent methyltransferase|nr:class I SAM-dependent methyltransferase [Candidatus Paceibacterota bacterium]